MNSMGMGPIVSGRHVPRLRRTLPQRGNTVELRLPPPVGGGLGWGPCREHYRVAWSQETAYGTLLPAPGPHPALPQRVEGSSRGTCPQGGRGQSGEGEAPLSSPTVWPTW